MSKFDPQRFGVLIIDEAHHATSPSYRRVIDYYRTNPALKVLGVTATPDRADEEALGQVFQSVAFDYEVLDAIHDGWLVPIEQQMVHVEGLDYSSIRTTAGRPERRRPGRRDGGGEEPAADGVGIAGDHRATAGAGVHGEREGGGDDGGDLQPASAGHGVVGVRQDGPGGAAARAGGVCRRARCRWCATAAC